MTTLGSHMSEAEDIERQSTAIEKWIGEQENVVAEMLKRPAKLRADAAQLDVNMVTDLRQLVNEKGDVLDDLASRRASLGLKPNHTVKIALDTLDEHVSVDFFKRASLSLLLIRLECSSIVA